MNYSRELTCQRGTNASSSQIGSHINTVRWEIIGAEQTIKNYVPSLRRVEGVGFFFLLQKVTEEFSPWKNFWRSRWSHCGEKNYSHLKSPYLNEGKPAWSGKLKYLHFIKIMRTSRDPFDESTTIVNYKVTKHKIPLVPMPLLAEVALLTDRLVLG